MNNMPIYWLPTKLISVPALIVCVPEFWWYIIDSSDIIQLFLISIISELSIIYHQNSRTDTCNNRIYLILNLGKNKRLCPHCTLWFVNNCLSKLGQTTERHVNTQTYRCPNPIQTFRPYQVHKPPISSSWLSASAAVILNKIAVTPLPTHWIYCRLALSNRFDIFVFFSC